MEGAEGETMTDKERELELEIEREIEREIQREIEMELAAAKEEKKKKKKKKKHEQSDEDLSVLPEELGEDGSAIPKEEKKKEKKAKKHKEKAVEEVAEVKVEEPKVVEIKERSRPSLSLEEFHAELKPKRIKKPGAFWKKPPTIVYKDNFGYGVNGYQPMIDYLDYKDSGGLAKQEEVHLPYSEERCMTKYCSSKPFRTYDNTDIDQYIDKGEKIRREIRQNDAAGTSNVLHRTHTNWSMTAKYVQLVKNSYAKDYNKKKKTEEEEDAEIERRFKENVKPLKKEVVPKATTNSQYLREKNNQYQREKMDAGDVLTHSYHNKMEHEANMAARRERMKRVDEDFDECINKCYSSVARISGLDAPRAYQTTTSLRDVLGVTDALIEQNSQKRRREMQALNERVLNVASYDQSRNRLSTTLRSLDNEISAMDRETEASRRRQQNDRIRDSALNNSINTSIIGDRGVLSGGLAGGGSYTSAHDNFDSTYNRLKHRYCSGTKTDEDSESVVDPDMYNSYRVPREDTISDVQTRVISRANEMQGITTESRKIHNMSRYVNTITPRCNVGSTVTTIRPSRVEANIDQMARTLATSGKARRRYDVDDEMEAPVSNLNTNATELYCTKERQKPQELVPSNSSRVRNAAIVARSRNALLNN